MWKDFSLSLSPTHCLCLDARYIIAHTRPYIHTQSRTQWFSHACYPADISEIMPKTKKDRFSIVVSGFLSDGILVHFSFRNRWRTEPKMPCNIETFCHKSLFGFALRWLVWFLWEPFYFFLLPNFH